MHIIDVEPNDSRNSPTISVLDHDAFAAKHIPHLGYTVKESKVFHWRAQGWKKLEGKLTSPEFSCGGHKWQVFLSPLGLPNETISVYLDHANSNLNDGWHACAQFALVISNPHDYTIHTVTHAHHRFTPKECDWGTTRFGELRKLTQPLPGQNRPIIEEDSAVVSVYLRVLEDPTGVLWHNFVNYDSKKETGYVGLKNQGSTGYMNTVLQSLFCTNSLRKAIYRIPTEGQRPTECVSLALQRVFYNLQTSNQPVETTELTKSFGWKPLDSYSQRDVQEFNKLLQNKLEFLMKGTHAEGVISRLFVGKMKSFIKCVNVDYESYRVEEFHDLQLNVKGLKTLYDAFRDYVAIETLDGELRYQAEGHGLQDARKGVIFQSLPPVLHLSLKRYEYDVQCDAVVKINDRFEFPFEIDLDRFLDETADRSEPWKYRLHGVIAHSGDLHGGHYFAFIKPDRHSRWLKFDDERVTPVTDREVLGENYGGESLSGVVPQKQWVQVKTTRRFTNARMLVYIRETAVDEVLAPVTQEDIPSHMRQGMDEEHTETEAKKKQKEEPHLYLTVKVVNDEAFTRYEGFDLASVDGRSSPPSDLPTFCVLGQMTYSGFKLRVAKRFGYPESLFRLWVLVNRQNKTVRPDTHIPENEPTLTVELIRNNMAMRCTDLLLYLDIPPDPSKASSRETLPNPHLPAKGIKLGADRTVIIFLKHFDAAKQTLFGIGKLYVPITTKVGDLVPVINERMKWTSGTLLKLYEEIKPGMIELMKPNRTLHQSEIQDGDIICFQNEISDQEARGLESEGLYSNPPQFYAFLHNRVTVLFKPKFYEPGADQPEFSLVLNKKQNYDTIAGKVGERLKHEPMKLRFTTTKTDGKVKSVVKRGANQTIAAIITSSYPPPSHIVILYERLDVSIIDLETKRALTVTWVSIHNKWGLTYPFLLSKTSTVRDLIKELSKHVQLTQMGTGRIRVFKMAEDGETRDELTEAELIGNIPDPVELFAEEIREELDS